MSRVEGNDQGGVARLSDIERRISAVERTQYVLPAGAIVATGSTTAPAGWLMCDGSVVSRTTYEDLFAAIGTRFNVGGEAGTDFRLPAFNNENRYPRGASAPGTKSGAATHDHTMAHTHAFSGRAGNAEITIPDDAQKGPTVTEGGHDHAFSGTTGGSSAADTGSASSLPPSQDAAYMIKI